ncbi:hypothetical protein H0H87_000675 [Tephrocybe sp. NHM501043]|nr:hypothetical protein H0H87_000675 [Tephrocybe sp. NHM501043]
MLVTTLILTSAFVAVLFKPFRYNNTILLRIEVIYVSVWRLQHVLLAIDFFIAMILTVLMSPPLLNFNTLTHTMCIADTSLSAAPGIPSSIPSSTLTGDPSQLSSIPAAPGSSSSSLPPSATRCFLGSLITLPILLFGLLLSFVLGREFSYVREISADR